MKKSIAFKSDVFVLRQNLKPGMIIRFEEDLDNTTARDWVVLSVTQKHLQREGCMNAEKSGLYAFGGMWYGDDPLDVNSYGKIRCLYDYKHVYLIHENLKELDVETVKQLVD